MASDTPHLPNDAPTVLVTEGSLTPAMLRFERACDRFERACDRFERACDRFERRLDLFESRLVFRLGLIMAIGVGLVLTAISIGVGVILNQLG